MTFSFFDSLILNCVSRSLEKWDWAQYDVPLRHVVWASVENGKFEVSFLARKRNKRKGPLFLQTCSGVVDEVVQDMVGGFMQDLQNAAYAGVKPERRLKVLVNPKAGPVSWQDAQRWRCC